MCASPVGLRLPRWVLAPGGGASSLTESALQAWQPAERVRTHLRASLRYARFIVFSSAVSGTSSTRHGLTLHTAPCACASIPPGVAQSGQDA